MALDSAPLVDAGSRIDTPSAFYCTGEENLRITSFGSVAAVTLALRARFLNLDGTIAPTSERHVPNSDRTVASSELPLGKGWLLGCEVFAVAGSPRVGQVFVLVEIIRGSGSAATQLHTLLQGYVTDTSRLGAPGAENRGSTDGSGVIRSITGTDPAAGVEISETVPTNARWRLLSFRANFVADATVINRYPRLIVDDGALGLFQLDPAAAHVASTVVSYTSLPGIPRQSTTLTDPNWGYPTGMTLMGGFRIRTSTVAIQAGDNWTAPQMCVEEWIED